MQDMHELIEQAAVLDIIALGYTAIGDLRPVPAFLDMVSLLSQTLETESF